jgi:hypothetical protein
MKTDFFSYVRLYTLVQVTNFLKEFAVTVFKVECPLHIDDEGSNFLWGDSLIYQRTRDNVLGDYHFQRSRLHNLKPNLIFVSQIVTHIYKITASPPICFEGVDESPQNLKQDSLFWSPHSSPGLPKSKQEG